MKVLVVSDTHGQDENLERVVMSESPFDAFIHCGDVEGRENFIEALVECNCCMVSGNNDFFSDLPKDDKIVLNGNRIFVTHGHGYGVSFDNSGVADAARCRGCNIAMFGHTHVPVIEDVYGVLTINPGSLSYPRQPDRRPSYVILDIDDSGRVAAEIKYL